METQLLWFLNSGWIRISWTIRINAQKSQPEFQQNRCENHISRVFSFSSPDMMMRLCWWWKWPARQTRRSEYVDHNHNPQPDIKQTPTILWARPGLLLYSYVGKYSPAQRLVREIVKKKRGYFTLRLTVSVGPLPPPYEQPDHKISVFLTTSLWEPVKNYSTDFFC